MIILIREIKFQSSKEAARSTSGSRKPAAPVRLAIAWQRRVGSRLFRSDLVRPGRHLGRSQESDRERCSPSAPGKERLRLPGEGRVRGGDLTGKGVVGSFFSPLISAPRLGKFRCFVTVLHGPRSAWRRVRWRFDCSVPLWSFPCSVGPSPWDMLTYGPMGDVTKDK